MENGIEIRSVRLDIIVYLLYLRNECIVAIHDTIEEHMTCMDIEIAAELLFDTATAVEKYLMWEDDSNVGGL